VRLAVVMDRSFTTFFAAGAALFIGLAAIPRVGAADMSKGAYLAKAGDCISCHTAGPEAVPYAGGLPIESPVGIIYSTNITPDPVHGIGRYTLDDFARAVRDGVAKNGSRLYPAMPYASFTAISDEDVRALYDYFMHEVGPVSHAPPETRLPFPFNQRGGLFFWDLAFVEHARFQPNEKRSAEWNRGAYLVQSLGHCGACHTPRGFAFQEKAYSEASPQYLSGAVINHWYASNLRGDPASGLGRWQEADIVEFLRVGHGGGAMAFGSMTDVVENSMQYLREDDLKAIAHYLKSLPARGEDASYRPEGPDVAVKLAALQSGEVEQPGAGLYASFCAKCHRLAGDGKPGQFPKLAGNSVVLAGNPASLIRLLLEGAAPPKTGASPKPHKMPGFAAKFTDRQIAEVLSLIRNSWGNAASPVTTRQVATLRHALQKKP
jgi:mono/diheme cytochrome c family protein